jgi:hypothetical protein
LFGNQEGTAGFVAPAKAVDDVVDRLMTMSMRLFGKLFQQKILQGV